MIDLFINGTNIREEYGICLLHHEISPAEPKENYVDIPGGDGAADLTTALTNGEVKYSNRTITMTLGNVDRSPMSEAKYRNISNAFHGQEVQLIFSNAVGYYWQGRFKLDSWVNDDKVTEVEASCTAQPYALELLSSTDDWLWDDFNFETGVVRGYKDIVIDGTTTVTVCGSRKRVCPEITCSDTMSVTFNEATYELSAGANRIIEIVLSEGLQDLIFTGTGTVSIEFRGGTL